ncbi:UNVERIFIED_CONTAM: Septum-promoting GTP-binding protein 1 [Sesamum latifolium]|uniref:Septum-promoting GTP-binding protein 1 n=1 Tax=Sesamum latifolium TaxID=2727402 RepID=A0AAW2TM27_9LAMI
MHQLTRKNVHFNIKRRILWRISILRRYLRTFWRQFFACGVAKTSIKYRHLAPPATATATATTATVSSSSSYLPSSPKFVVDGGFPATDDVVRLPRCSLDSSDLVSLKISLLGDPDIGKTSFLRKYAGGEKGEEEYAETGVNQMDKTLYVKGQEFLTAYGKWETAIPVLIGTKFDEFVQLPIDLQWTIASQARSYAKAMNATLFFSSATYNINVNKIFKFVTAKLFNLQWNLPQSHHRRTIIDF